MEKIVAIEPSPPVKKLVVLEDGVLTSMAHSEAFLKEFPFIKTLQGTKPKKSGCGGCNAAMNARKADEFSRVKAAFASMGDDRKRVLKQMLNTRKIRIIYRDGKRIQERTF